MTYRFTTLPLVVALAGPLVLLAPWPTDGADAALMVFNLLAIDLGCEDFVGVVVGEDVLLSRCSCDDKQWSGKADR